MNAHVMIAPDLEKRIQALVARSAWTREEIIADALENGHSLEWQEQFVAHVEAGLAEADAGEFASEDEIEAVLAKYRPD